MFYCYRPLWLLGIALLSGLLAGPARAQAPATELAVRVGQPLPLSYVGSDAIVWDLAVDAVGNSYVTGIFAGDIQLGSFTLSTGNGNQNSDIFVAKYDPAGICLWAQRAGSAAGNEMSSTLAVDATGNVYVAGNFSGATCSFGSTTLTNASVGLNVNDLFVARLSPAGQWQWAVRAGGAQGEEAYGLAVDLQGNVLITGAFDSPQLAFGSSVLAATPTTSPSSVQRDDIFVAKLDAAGTWRWGVRAGGSGGDIGRSLVTDAGGNAYLTGSFGSPSADFGSVTLTQPGAGAVFVAKISATGAFQWASAGGGNNLLGDSGNDIALDAAGNVLVAGYFYASGARFGSAVLANAGGSDVLVAGLSAAGSWQWAVSTGSSGNDGALGVAAGPQGEVLVGGYYWGGAIPFGATTLPYQGNYYDGFVARLAGPTATWRWALPVSGSQNDVVHAVAVDAQQRPWLAGYYQSPSLSLPPFTLPGASTPASGSGLLARLGAGPQATITGDSLLCGASAQLTAQASAPVVAYRWSTGATTASISVSQPGLYTVTVTFAGGVTSTAQFQVRSLTPTVRISGDSLLCAGLPLVLTAVASHPAATYRWSTGATTPSISVAQAGTYTVTAQVGTACVATAQHTVRQPTLRLTGAAQLCGSGSSLQLMATAPGATGLRWNTGATTTALTVTQPGSYTVVATFAGGCTLTATQVVSQPRLVLGGDTVLCGGRSATLTAAYPAPATYEWNTGATGPSLTVAQAGTYRVTARGTLPPFCVSAATVNVRAVAPLPGFTLGADTTLCEFEKLVLRAPAPSTASGPVTYLWSDSSTGPMLRVSQPGTYSLRLRTSCEELTASRHVSYRSCLLIPNIITPNGDQRNETFAVQGLAPGPWELTLYNRWGRQVYYAPAYAHDWGAEAAPGLYYYLLRQASTTYKGWVEVAR